MKMEEVGFYTLSDERTKNISSISSMMRAELILTDKCNFNCPYCRGVREDIRGTMSMEKAKGIVDLWAKDNLVNIRLSGGEPTLYPNIVELVKYIKSKDVKRIAMSSNGSADTSLYKELVSAGVNDFSISLDACCATFGDKMAGVGGKWNTVVENIKELSKLTYVTVGIVVTQETLPELKNTIEFAASLGVSDIRIISAAQFNELFDIGNSISEKISNRYPILKYRLNNMKNNINVRGIKETDSKKCKIVLDDMAIAGDYHFPCIIYLREGGNPIGKVGENMRKERFEWYLKHDSYVDPICKNNCLDCIVMFNNKCSIKREN